MHVDPADDGLTPELAAQIHSELELGPEDETRALAAARREEEGRVELVLYDEGGEQPDVVVTLGRDEALALAAALVALAANEPSSAG